MNILILSANPTNTNRIRIDKEIREIQLAVERSKNRDSINLIIKSATTIDDIRRALLDNTPEIAHFCCHGANENGLILDSDHGNNFVASASALIDLFQIFSKTTQCVLLNACNSSSIAKSMAADIGFSIGMNDTINDDAAICYAKAFYDAIGAGNSINLAHSIACNALKFNHPSDSAIPALYQKPNSANLINEGLISVNFDNIEVRAILAILSDFTGLNIVVSDTVCGKISIRLKNVVWRKVLNQIEDEKGLISIFEGENITVRPLLEAMHMLELRKAREIIAKELGSKFDC